MCCRLCVCCLSTFPFVIDHPDALPSDACARVQEAADLAALAEQREANLAELAELRAHLSDAEARLADDESRIEDLVADLETAGGKTSKLKQTAADKIKSLKVDLKKSLAKAKQLQDRHTAEMNEANAEKAALGTGGGARDWRRGRLPFAQPKRSRSCSLSVDPLLSVCASPPPPFRGGADDGARRAGLGGGGHGRAPGRP